MLRGSPLPYFFVLERSSYETVNTMSSTCHLPVITPTCTSALGIRLVTVSHVPIPQAGSSPSLPAPSPGSIPPSLASPGHPVASLAPATQQPHVSRQLLKPGGDRLGGLRQQPAEHGWPTRMHLARFAGSMRSCTSTSSWFRGVDRFVSLSEFDSYPFGLARLIVALEAIFLSTLRDDHFRTARTAKLM